MRLHIHHRKHYCLFGRLAGKTPKPNLEPVLINKHLHYPSSKHFMQVLSNIQHLAAAVEARASR